MSGTSALVELVAVCPLLQASVPVTGRIFGPYPALVAAVHDGDTFTVDLDLGFGVHQQGLSCRVFGINAPELATQAGKDALTFALTLLRVGDRVQVVSHGWDKYGGRFLGVITLADGSDFAALMVKAGHALPYDGHGPKPVSR